MRYIRTIRILCNNVFTVYEISIGVCDLYKDKYALYSNIYVRYNYINVLYNNMFVVYNNMYVVYKNVRAVCNK